MITSSLTQKKHHPWLIMSLCGMGLFYKYVLQVFPSIMTSALMAQFHIHGTGLGNLAAVFFYTYLVMQLFVGPLLDRYPVHFLASCALLVSALGGGLFAHASTLWVAQLARGMMGVGAAFATVTYLKMASQWCKPQHFPVVSGLLTTAGMMGALFGQLPLTYLMQHHGWRAPIFLLGWLGLLLALLFVFFVRNNEHHGQDNHPSPPSIKACLSLMGRKKNWLLMLYSGLAFSPLAIFGGLWGDAFLQAAYTLRKPQAAFLTSLMFMGFALGGPLWGFLTSQMQRCGALMYSALCLALLSCLLALYLPHYHPWVEPSALFFFGVGSAGIMLGFTVGTRANPIALAATVIALINTGDAFFGAFSETLVGKFLDLGHLDNLAAHTLTFSVHDYHRALSLLPIYLCLALVALWLSQRAP